MMKSTLCLGLLVLCLAVTAASTAQTTCPPGQMIGANGACTFPPAGSQGTCPVATVADGAGGCVALTCPLGQMITSSGACAFPPAGSQGACAAGMVADGAGGCVRQGIVAAPTLPMPMFAGVTSDGEKIGFSWWAVKGAIGYEIEQSPDTRVATRVGSVTSTTLGYSVPRTSPGPTYYRLVALGAGGARGASAWFLYWAPTITSVAAEGADVVVRWSGVKAAPGGYEVWRTTDPQRPATRVGAVSSSTLTSRDKQAGAGPFYYHVVAVGAGGARATSAWYPYNAPRAITLAPGPRPASSAQSVGAPAQRPTPVPVGAAAPATSAATPSAAAMSKDQVAQAYNALRTLIDSTTGGATGSGTASGSSATSTSTGSTTSAGGQTYCSAGGSLSVATTRVGNSVQSDMTFADCRSIDASGSTTIYGSISLSVIVSQITGNWPASGSMTASETITGEITYLSPEAAGVFLYDNFADGAVVTRKPANFSVTRTLTGTITVDGLPYTFNGESFTSTVPLN